jgi:hypothetical protein
VQVAVADADVGHPDGDVVAPEVAPLELDGPQPPTRLEGREPVR